MRADRRVEVIGQDDNTYAVYRFVGEVGNLQAASENEPVFCKDILDVTFLIAQHLEDESFLSGIKEKRKELITKQRSKPKW